MELEIKVLSYRGVAPERAQTAIFTEAGGEIGRGIDCQMVLEDPTKTISRKHGRIACENGRFYFVDNSAAGTEFWERNLVLLQNRCELSDGDRFRIGDYELTVSIRGFEPVNTPSQFPFGSAMGGTSARSFPSIDNPFPTYMPGLENDPFGPLPGGTPAPPQPAPPSFIGQPDVAPIHESFVPPSSVVAPVPPGGLEEFDFGELLSGLDGAAAPVVKPKEEVGFELPEELLAGLQGLAQAEAGEALPVEAQRTAVEAASPQERLPEQGGVTPLQITPGAAVHAEPAQVLPVAEPRVAPEAIPRPGLSTGQPVQESPRNPSLAVPVHSEPAVAVPEVLFRAFVEGAGIREDLISDPTKLPDTMRALGAIFRELVDGVMTVLRARNELKSQFRVSMTTMRAANNNPLKFTASVDDALKLLIQPDHPGFLEPQQAVRDGMADVMNHQLAMTAGIQASLAAALRRFNPDSFEKAYEEGIVFQKKAKCWDAFVKAYPQISNEILENIFGDEFAEVYERQMHILRSTGHGGATGGSR
jgi:type VI secretion system FHA domain protein